MNIPLRLRNPKLSGWSNQHVLESHIEYLRNADMTNGYHCGYISPIPYLEFDHILSEQDFRAFILALSNDIAQLGQHQSHHAGERRHYLCG